MELKVYTAPWCRDCRQAKQFLAEHKIPYTEIDIDQVPEAAEEVLLHTGKRAIPQFVIDGKWVQPYLPGQGFLFDEMSALLGVTRPQDK
jgi:glutaredoxin